MAQVPVSMQVIIYPKNKTVAPYPATIVGNAWITGLQPGGGPIIPPDISVPPDTPGVWPPGTDIGDYIDIGLPPIDPPPPDVPNPPDMVKPPPPQGGWAWSPTIGWIYVPGSGSPGPKR